MQIQRKERAALHRAGLKLMKLQSCGLLRQQNEATSTLGKNTAVMIRRPLRLRAMTQRGT